MKVLRQVLVVLLANGLLVFFIAELNSAIAPFSVYIVVAGALVVFPALKLPVRAGLPAAVVTGALLDALFPTPPGLLLFAVGFLYAVLQRFRVRLRVQRAVHFAVVACAANLVLFLVLSAWYFPATDSSTYGWRFLLELALSEATVFVLSLWFFDLQEASLELFAARPQAEDTA